MTWNVGPLSIVFCLAAIAAGGISLVAWHRREAPAGRPLSLLSASLAWWALCNALDFASTTLEGHIFWSQVSYVGIQAAPVLFFLFALEYSGHGRWLNRAHRLLIWVIPVIILALAATNGSHHMIWSRIILSPGTNSTIAIFEHGPGYWLAIVWIYALLIAGSILLLQTGFHSRDLYRRQAASILVGVPLPWLANVLYLMPFNPIPGVDLTPILFVGSCGVLLYGFTKLKLVDLVPVARSTLIEMMPDMLLVIDERRRIVDTNPAACELLKRSRGELIGMDVRAALQEYSYLAERCTCMIPGEVVIVDAARGRRFLDLEITPLKDVGRGVTGHMLHVRDITTRKMAEREIHEANLELALQLEELESRNRELDAFSHTVAHDLRTPLSLMQGYCELLSLGRLDDHEEQEALSAMLWASRKMNDIIEELLLLARVRKTEVVPQPLDMAAVLREALRRLATEIEQSGAQIAQPASSDWPLCMGHGPWVEEVWANYIGNAIKYGGRPPHIELGSRVSADGMVWLWVRDDGPGIRSEAQSLLFAPFERVGQTRASGYGLGLSIVRRIVEKLGGEVDLSSEYGAGSTFLFSLPAWNDANTVKERDGDEQQSGATAESIAVAPEVQVAEEPSSN